MISSRPFLVALPVFFLLGVLSLSAAGAAQTTERKGKIQGESHVNLRSGPALSFPSVAVLKNGDEVGVEQEVKSWYRVSLADGRKGYVHKTLVAFVRNPEDRKPLQEKKTIPEFSPSVPIPQAAPLPPEPSPQPGPPLQVAAPKPEPYKPPQLLQWKGWVVVQWLGAAACVFLLGWIFGGNYYLRRDRVRTKKLRL